MNFSKKLKNLRNSISCNQFEFGKMLGLSQQGVSDLENGKKKPSKTLLAYLEYRYNDIFGKESIGIGSEKNLSATISTNDFIDGPRADRIIKNLSKLEQIDERGYTRAEAYIDGCLDAARLSSTCSPSSLVNTKDDRLPEAAKVDQINTKNK